MNSELTSIWSDEEINSFQIKLLEFLAYHTNKFTLGDSSSVPKEIAQELFNSICFTLRIGTNDEFLVYNKLLNGDIHELYKIGVKSIVRKIKYGKRLWEIANYTSSLIENISLRDTLKEIGEFWNKYDYNFFAHEIPCYIDYQLCHPVPNSLLGIDYVIEYLRRMNIENRFLLKFELKPCINLLKCYCVDYVGLLINLYEPIVTNAIGLILINKNVQKLNISLTEREEITKILSPLSNKELINILKESAIKLCDTLNIDKEDDIKYMIKLAENLYPRIKVVLSSGNVGGIFLKV